MTKAAFARVYVPSIGNVLVPMDADGREILEAMKPDKPVMTKIHTPRNVRHHRMFFALLRLLIDGGAWEGSEDSLRDAVKTGCGYFDTITGLDGRTYYKPRSMAFESMAQDEFAKFFDRALHCVSTRLLGSEDWEALRDRIGEIVDGDLLGRVDEANSRRRTA